MTVRRFAVLFSSAVCLFCAEGKALEPKEREALALLTLAPATNPVQECVIAALFKIQLLVAALKEKLHDDVIIQSLNKKSGDISVVAHGRILAAEWKKSHLPQNIAALDFEYCIKQDSPDAPSIGNLEKTCFALAVIPATAEYFKNPKKYDKNATLNELRRGFGASFSEDFLAATLEAVYSNDVQRSRYRAHRQLFAVCIGKVRAPS